MLEIFLQRRHLGAADGGGVDVLARKDLDDLEGAFHQWMGGMEV